MAGKLDGKVALITGAARGQGRSHAVTLAREGADIVAVDRCAPIESVAYPLSSPDDLADTATLVAESGRRVETMIGDVRSSEDMRKATHLSETKWVATSLIVMFSDQYRVATGT